MADEFARLEARFGPERLGQPQADEAGGSAQQPVPRLPDLSIDEIVEQIIHGDQANGLSDEALAAEVQRALLADPVRFAEQADLFQPVPPVFKRSLLWGWYAAVREGQAI